MKKTAMIKRITALFCVSAMLFLTSCGGNNTVTEEENTISEEESIFAEEYTATTKNVQKTETVYINLANDGKPRSITVSDWLHADSSRVFIQDKTTLENITVTKGHAAPDGNSGNITWHMASSDVYYEGTASKELPVDIAVKYYLDGSEISAADLAGKSGKVKIEIKLTNKLKNEVEVNGKAVTMYTPFVVVGGMMLDYATFSEIEVDNGLSLGMGTYEAVVLAGSPGIRESLALDSLKISGFEGFNFSDTFTINVTAREFNLGDAYFMIAPLSALDLKFDTPETLEQVQSILNEINDIEKVINQIDPEGKLVAFMADSEKVAEMLDVMQKGLKVYSENKAMLKVMSEYMTPENLNTLTEFLNSLDTEQIQQITNVLSNVSALQSVIDSMLQLSTGFKDIMPMLEGFSQALEDPEVAASFERLPETMEVISELADFMNENEEVLDIMTALVSSDDFDKFTGMLDTVITENGQNIGSIDISNLSGDAQTLLERAQVWIKLDYPIYTAAPEYMTTKCTFICKTDPIP